MRSLLTLLAIAVAATLGPASACEWPSTWIGPSDTAYRALHIGVFYYGAVLHDMADEKGEKPLPAGKDWLSEMAKLPELTPEAMQSELARTKFEMDEAARFYWRNSRFNCAFDYEWHADFTPRLYSSIAQADPPYFSPNGCPAYDGLQEKYDGLCQLCVLYVYDKSSGQLKRVKGGGGFTNGADAAKHLCGWSWWAATSADNVCGSDWLQVHEFGHQVDSLFEQSGHPEFWFNHIALVEGNIARYGEHFDANAFILRRCPEADWLDLKWGELRYFQDKDMDGVPDADNWLTSRGLEVDPDPFSRDADCDGLTDFAELMASDGNRLGHGERLHPMLKPCDPYDPDTDRDGIPDGKDPAPMWPGLAAIPSARSGEQPRSSKVTLVGSPDDLDFGVELSYVPDTWSDSENKNIPGALSISLFWGKAGAPPPERDVKLMLDLQNNGWYMGDDNYRIILSSGTIKSIMRLVASSAVEWPHEDDKAVDPAKVHLEPVSEPAPFAAGVRLTLTKDVFPELVTKPGTMLALNAGVRKAGEPWFYMLADPNSQMAIEMR